VNLLGCHRADGGNKIMVLRDVYVLIPETSEYVRLHSKGEIKTENGIKVTHQLTLK
jgi:hypothetical protein